MAYFTGQVAAKDLLGVLLSRMTQVQAGESEAWWKKESSLETDGVYTSKGSTGTERIVLVMRAGTTGQSIITGIAQDYTPGVVNTAGVFTTLETQHMYFFTTAQDVNTMITYDISVMRDRVIIHLQGDKLIAQWANPVQFLGMPIRYDINDKKCIVRACSEQNIGVNYCRVLENSIGLKSQNYTWHTTQSPGNPSWGSNYFLEPLHFGQGVEGLRGELDGIYGSHSDGLVDSDIIDVNGVKFKVIKRVVYGSNGYPRDCLLMRQK